MRGGAGRTNKECQVILGLSRAGKLGLKRKEEGTGTWGLGAFREDCMIGAVNIGMETQLYQLINQQ